MLPNLRKLPIGVQDFAGLRMDGYLYVDKTAFVYKLAHESKQYFLGRPRRFGKSLFISTIKYYFQGRKDLFEGLAIAGLENEWAEYPVFHIDMNVESYTDLTSLHKALNSNLIGLEDIYGRDEREDSPASRLMGLLKRAYAKTGKRVVVLFDEYDKPLLGTMDNLEANEAIRTELKGFYGLMKSMDEYLRFVFYTGVTKFSKISIFSDLNQPNDISLAEDYAEICGISEKELLQNFQPEISLMAEKRELTVEQTLAKLKQCYDGYHFAENSAGMYNPFSLLNAFFKLSFDYYWYQTGTPSFLVKMIASGEMDIRDFKNDVYVDKLQLNDYKSGVNDPVPILYQSGYLTIKNYIPEENAYILGYPNEEVKYGFMRNLADEFIPYTHLSPTNFSAIMFTRDLRTGNVDGFMTRLKSRFASIPYDLTDRTERSYQLGFYLIFELMGQYVETEVKSARGRADVVVKTKDAIFVFEFKMDKNATAEDALRQIDEKGYLIPYTADKRKLIKTGVEISAEERGISRWIVVES